MYKVFFHIIVLFLTPLSMHIICKCCLGWKRFCRFSICIPIYLSVKLSCFLFYKKYSSHFNQRGFPPHSLSLSLYIYIYIFFFLPFSVFLFLFFSHYHFLFLHLPPLLSQYFSPTLLVSLFFLFSHHLSSLYHLTFFFSLPLIFPPPPPPLSYYITIFMVCCSKSNILKMLKENKIISSTICKFIWIINL